MDEKLQNYIYDKMDAGIRPGSFRVKPSAICKKYAAMKEDDIRAEMAKGFDDRAAVLRAEIAEKQSALVNVEMKNAEIRIN